MRMFSCCFRMYHLPRREEGENEGRGEKEGGGQWMGGGPPLPPARVNVGRVVRMRRSRVSIAESSRVWRVCETSPMCFR